MFYGEFWVNRCDVGSGDASFGLDPGVSLDYLCCSSICRGVIGRV